jgi:hypothetical protein
MFAMNLSRLTREYKYVTVTIVNFGESVNGFLFHSFLSYLHNSGEIWKN